MGDAELWVFGYLDYEDVFGGQHTNRFAYRLLVDGDETTTFFPDGPDSYHEYA